MVDHDDERLFAQYFIVGAVYGDPNFVQVRIDSIDPSNLSATGTSLSKGNGFREGEAVFFTHVDEEVYRVTSERNDHGHPVFLGEGYSDGGFGIGS
jgi:hypothetical protein